MDVLDITAMPLCERLRDLEKVWYFGTGDSRSIPYTNTEDDYILCNIFASVAP